MILYILVAVVLAYKELGYDPNAVKADVRTILLNPQADDGNYGPFLIRLAWHCAGTYRRTDGRGGCDGARIRFDPERTWGDNAGLIPGPHEDAKPADQRTITALELLAPTKYKYGNALSWGDLIVIAGNVAIEEMDGPEMDFCGGRVDVYEGYSIEELDVSMIYVDAGDTSADDVRAKFAKMDMNDQETVALIGGGHAFGRCHAYRSGFDGPWTTNPSKFDNEYFHLLQSATYSESTEISGQFETVISGQTYIMLHGDYVLLDDEMYRNWIDIYADDMDLLYTDFKAAWEKLMNRDMGLRPCANTIPEIPETGIDYEAVKAEVIKTLPDPNHDAGSWGPLYVRLGWHCAGTYRETDHIGGCNGSRIRHKPEADWGSNKDVDLALDRLRAVYEQFDGLSWADLIIIASTTALEEMGSLPMPFCPGRTDVSASVAKKQSANLDPEIYLDAETATAPLLRESMKIMGFTDREMVVLNGGGHAVGQCHHFRSGFQGPWTHDPTVLSNDFFKLLLKRTWVETTVSQTGRKQFQDTETGTLMMLFSDMVFRNDDTFRAIVEEYAQDNDLFLRDFRDAWINLVNKDRFGGVCVTSMDEEETKDPSTPSKDTTETEVDISQSDNDLPVDTSESDLISQEDPVQVTCATSTDSSTNVLLWVLIVILVIVVVLQIGFFYMNRTAEAQDVPYLKSEKVHKQKLELAVPKSYGGAEEMSEVIPEGKLNELEVKDLALHRVHSDI